MRQKTAENKRAALKRARRRAEDWQGTVALAISERKRQRELASFAVIFRNYCIIRSPIKSIKFTICITYLLNVHVNFLSRNRLLRAVGNTTIIIKE